jgi:hypothetical protein
MSGRALYRVMVRMLYDPPFATAVYVDPEPALAGVDLTAAERVWLRRADRRAWGTDPLRRSRSLAGLMEEFPAASAMVVRRAREGTLRPEPELLDAFFSSGTFHRMIQEGTSMVLAFGAYLEEPGHGGVLADPRVRWVARIESAIARVRRAGSGLVDRSPARSSHPERDGPPARPVRAGIEGGREPAGVAGGRDGPAVLTLSPAVEVLVAPSGAYELHSRIARALRAARRAPVEAILDPRWSLPVLLDLDAGAPEHLLIERLDRTAEEEPTVPGELGRLEMGTALVTPELARLLLAARDGVSEEDLRNEALRLGAAREEVEEILQGLVRDGSLERTPRAGTGDRTAPGPAAAGA